VQGDRLSGVLREKHFGPKAGGRPAYLEGGERKRRKNQDAHILLGGGDGPPPEENRRDSAPARSGPQKVAIAKFGRSINNWSVPAMRGTVPELEKYLPALRPSERLNEGTQSISFCAGKRSRQNKGGEVGGSRQPQTRRGSRLGEPKSHKWSPSYEGLWKRAETQEDSKWQPAP